jgi:hypothetical protein
MIHEAEKYALRMCGQGLKSEPNLNQHLPAFLRDAFLAGALSTRERTIKLEDALRRSFDFARREAPTDLMFEVATLLDGVPDRRK